MNLTGRFANPGPPPAWALAASGESPHPHAMAGSGAVVGLMEREAPTSGSSARLPAPAGSSAVVGMSVRLAPVHQVLDEVATWLTNQPHAAVSTRDVEALDRLTRRMEALKLSIIARAHTQETHRTNGASSTAAWVAGATRCGGGEAASQVALATTLETDLPATKDALAAGEVSVRNASIIAGAMTKLPEDLTTTERAKTEACLVADAKRLNPARLRKAALSALAAAQRTTDQVAEHQEDTLTAQEQAGYDTAAITMHDHGDGHTTGRFSIPTTCAQILLKVLQSMTAPRRDHLKTGTHTHLTDGSLPAADTSDGSVAALLRARNTDWGSLTWAQKRGRAFADLLEHLPTDALTGKVAATIVITLTLEQALAAAKTAQLQATLNTTTSQDSTGQGGTGQGVAFGPSTGMVPCDTGQVLSTSAARRLACNAGILPAILGGDSLPLDIGRQDRFFTDHQRTALATLYDTCAAQDCDRPYAWSELHHQHPWSHAGHTNLNNAIPLCGHHHRTIHHPEYDHHITQDGARKTVTFHRRA